MNLLFPCKRWGPPTTWSSPSRPPNWWSGSGGPAPEGVAPAGRPVGALRAGGPGHRLPGARVSRAGRPVQPTDTEYRLLFELSVKAGVALSYEELLEGVWGVEHSGDFRLCRGWRTGCARSWERMRTAPGTSSPKFGSATAWKRGGTGAGYPMKVAAWRPVTGSVVSGRPVPVAAHSKQRPSLRQRGPSDARSINGMTVSFTAVAAARWSRTNRRSHREGEGDGKGS